jgi:hypothetical protein
LREEEEQEDLEIQQFYERLLLVLNLQVVRQGHWKPLFARTAWDFNPTFQNVLGGQWSLGGQSLLVLVNYAPHPSQARFPLRFPRAGLSAVGVKDHLTGQTCLRDAPELSEQGLFVDLTAWGAHLFELLAYHY